jgi:hypothetical protein
MAKTIVVFHAMCGIGVMTSPFLYLAKQSLALYQMYWLAWLIYCNWPPWPYKSDCLLTKLEKAALGEEAYDGTCMAHYIKKWTGLYIDPLWFIAIYVLVTLAAYLRWH